MVPVQGYYRLSQNCQLFLVTRHYILIVAANDPEREDGLSIIRPGVVLNVSSYPGRDPGRSTIHQVRRTAPSQSVRHLVAKGHIPTNRPSEYRDNSVV